MRTFSVCILISSACTGGKHYTTGDADATDAGTSDSARALDAYEPDLSALNFASAASYATAVQPIAIAGGELTGDTYPDLAVTSYQNLSVAVFKNQQNGTFTNIKTISVGTGNQPSAVAVADFNGDNLADLAVTIYKSSATPNLLVFLNGGNGTSFSGPTTYSTGSGPFGIAVGRINGDNALDVVVSSSDSGELSVLLGNGNGTFQAARTIAVGAGPRDVAIADVNNDGKNDVVVANHVGNEIAVLIGDNQGGFTSTNRYPVGTDPYGVAIGDFNGDDKLDIVCASKGADRADVLLGKGNGTFADPASYDVGMQPESVTAADFNHDGQLDFAIANPLRTRSPSTLDAETERLSDRRSSRQRLDRCVPWRSISTTMPASTLPPTRTPRTESVFS